MNQLDSAHREMLLEFHRRQVQFAEIKRKSRNRADFEHKVRIWNDENLLRQKIASILQVPIDSPAIEHWVKQFYLEVI